MCDESVVWRAGLKLSYAVELRFCQPSSLAGSGVMCGLSSGQLVGRALVASPIPLEWPPQTDRGWKRSAIQSAQFGHTACRQ